MHKPVLDFLNGWLQLVEILDGVLRNYGDAYAVGFDMTNMSMMMGPGASGEMSSMEMGTSGNMSNGELKTGMQVEESTTEDENVGMQRQSEPSMEVMSMSMNETASSSRQPKVVNITDYQTAKILASEAQGLFTNQLMNVSLSGTTEIVINDIAAAFKELTSSINEKASPMEVMMIVHTKIHPNLVTAFGLQLGKSA